VGGSKGYFLVVWGLKEIVPGGRLRLCTQVELSCHGVSVIFIKEELGTETVF
jgi:hypothetical protein